MKELIQSHSVMQHCTSPYYTDREGRSSVWNPDTESEQCMICLVMAGRATVHAHCLQIMRCATPCGTWCASQVDSHTVGRGRALCGEAGVSVFLLTLFLLGFPFPLPTPLQKSHTYTHKMTTQQNTLLKTMSTSHRRMEDNCHKKLDRGLIVA